MRFLSDSEGTQCHHIRSKGRAINVQERTMRRRHTVCAMLLSAFSLLMAAPHAGAQVWPDKPVRWIVGFPPGGGADIVARLIGASVAQNLGQPINVENRPGAFGSIGAELAARSHPDGYTFLVADTGTLVHNTALFRKLPYNPTKDFTPVGLFVQTPLMLIVGPGDDAKTIQGAGAHHFGLEHFKRQAGLDMNIVPYKGAGPAVNDVVAGHLPAVMTDPSTASAMLRAGKLRALAVSSKSRLPEFPDVPTMTESVLPGFEAYAWVGLVAPSNTPAAIASRMHGAIQKALHDPEVVKRLSDFGLSPRLASSSEMGDLWKSDMRIWPDVIRQLGVFYD